MKQKDDAISENLRRMREERNLSYDQLAESTGVSKSMLRNIELGKSSPTVATMWKIANGLRVSFSALLKKTVSDVQVKAFKAEEPLIEADSHYRIFPLVPFDPEQPFETYYVEIDPDTVFKGEPHLGNIYEYVYVLKGEMEVVVDGELFEVKEREFIQFYANCPHEYRCIGDITATAIMKISYIS